MKTGQPCRRWREAIHLQVCGALEGQEAARIESHQAECAECRRYGEELQAAAVSLRWLGSRDVEPRPGFRARWTRAVEEAARRSGFGETATALAACWRGLLLRNLRPTLGVASLWILTLLFRFSAPDVSPTTHTTAARSPVEIYRMLTDREQMLAGQLGRQFPVLATPRTTPSIHPRSEGSPTQPAAHWEHEPGVDATVCKLSPNPIEHGRPSRPLLV